jgi:hypothetical protein
MGASIGFVVGPLIGASLGAVVGLLVFEVGTAGMWASIVAGFVFGLLVGALWGGFSRLGPPAPEDDPLPRRADGDWTVEDERGPASERDTRDRRGDNLRA